ncbi:MAG: hypothetical protein FJX42_02940 [Alphaproteobacteria bacterium]|nr:hypothetical protein [Alphaproteobacteria bacterium]
MPLVVLPPGGLARWLKTAPERTRRWVRAMDFADEAGSVLAVPGANGALSRILAVLPKSPEPWDFAAVSRKLPAAAYRLEPEPDAAMADAAALGWALAAYRFDRYRKSDGKTAPRRRWRGLDAPTATESWLPPKPPIWCAT